MALLTVILGTGLLRFDLATNGWDAPYTFYSEEGEALAWAHVVLDGGVLSRDVYCLYGPLATYPVVAAFALLEPSVWLWRVVIYALDLPALLAVFLLMRETCRTCACFSTSGPTMKPGVSHSERTGRAYASQSWRKRAALSAAGASIAPPR